MQVVSNGQSIETEGGDGAQTHQSNAWQNGDSSDKDDSEDVFVEDPEEAPDQHQTAVATSSTQQQLQCQRHISHFSNTHAHSIYLRYGIPLLLTLTFALLLASDIGSGVVAEYYLFQKGGILFDSQQLVHVSIFTTVQKLWSTRSFALAIFITCTSVSWPFVKLCLSLYAWVTPYTRPRRREMLLQVIDGSGKWSFVDIIVFVEILVAFRSRVLLPEGNYLDVFIVPKWGFFGFVLSTILSLLATQLILRRHRLVSYHTNDDDDEQQQCTSSTNHNTAPKQRLSQLSNTPMLLVVAALIVTSTLHLAGCLIPIYRITNQQGNIHEEHTYSVVTVGQAIPSSTVESVHVGITFFQYMWFFVVVAMPLWSNVMLATLYLVPMTRAQCGRVFSLSEMAFSWSGAEVLVVSTAFAILQVPAFGNGLVKVGCRSCYVVGSKILSTFAVLVVGTVCQVAVSVWLYRRAHRTLYGSSPPPLPPPPEQSIVSSSS